MIFFALFSVKIVNSQLLDELFKIGAEAVKQVVLELYPGMRIGMIYTIHTYGRGLGYKPHVHLVITKVEGCHSSEMA